MSSPKNTPERYIEINEILWAGMDAFKNGVEIEMNPYCTAPKDDPKERALDTVNHLYWKSGWLAGAEEKRKKI